MDVVLEKADDFKKCIDSIAVLIDEAEFIFDSNGLSLRATDPSQISMVDFSLKKDSFKKFDLGGKTKLGLDLDYLGQIMSRSKAGDELHLALEDDKNYLSVTFKGSSVRKFSMPLIDISASELPSPRIDFDAELSMKASVLQDALKDSALISTHVSLGIENKKFFVRAHSSKGELNSETEKDDKAITEMKVKDEAKSMFPLDYLSDMLKTASSDTEVKVFLKTNAPIMVNYKVGKADITYFLAPRIESE